MTTSESGGFAIYVVPFPGSATDHEDFAKVLTPMLFERSRKVGGGHHPPWRIDRVVGPHEGWVWFVLMR